MNHDIMPFECEKAAANFICEKLDKTFLNKADREYGAPNFDEGFNRGFTAALVVLTRFARKQIKNEQTEQSELARLSEARGPAYQTSVGAVDAYEEIIKYCKTNS